MEPTEPTTTEQTYSITVPDFQADEQPPVEELAATEQEPTSRQMRAVALEIVETAALALVIWLVLNTATARYVVEGVSMQPNLQTGQYFIVSRMAYWFNEPGRGDVIVFDYPNNPDDDYVKRIIGLPGETVAISQDGTVSINGDPLEEPYINASPNSPQRSWTVPNDSYFVMGDNRGSSSDSRSWGPLQEDFIIGKAWISYLPLDSIGTAPHFDYGE